MASYDVASTDSLRHVIKRIVDPLSVSQMASYDVASSIHESLHVGVPAVGARVPDAVAQPPGKGLHSSTFQLNTTAIVAEVH